MYRISVTKAVGGEVVSVPEIETDDKETALAKYRKVVDATAEGFNAEIMRNVGGWAEIFCKGEREHTTDGTIAYAKIKRPLHSPKAEKFEQ